MRDLIGLGVNLSEVKRLGLKLGEIIGCDWNTENGGFDDFLLRGFRFDFDFNQFKLSDSFLNDIFAIFLP